MRNSILKIDPNVTEKVGNIMSSKNCFIYEEKGVFKYGLAKTKLHFSFHSMVMYSNQKVHDYIVKNSESLNIRKGCVNFNTVDAFPLDVFKEFILLSKKADFTPIINRYKNK